jgi:transcriptional regulator NrdR family protein
MPEGKDLMQLKVIKADGSTEEYLHTKVLGTINHALGLVDQANVFIAEQFTEAITYFLYQREPGSRVTSSEISSMIEVVLASTPYDEAALALADYRYKRKMKRDRIEVTAMDMKDACHAAALGRDLPLGPAERWDKSRIVQDLVNEENLDRQTARAIASMVEEKVLKLDITRISRGLIKQIVLVNMLAMLQAEQHLQAAVAEGEMQKSLSDTEVFFRQQQKGFCSVGR